MTTIEKTPDLVNRLEQFEVFTGVPRPSLEWLVEQCNYVTYPKGAVLFQADDPVDHMQVIVEGQVVLSFPNNGRSQDLDTWDAGEVAGLLPFSRLRVAVATGTIQHDLSLLQLHRDQLPELVREHYALAEVLVHAMTSRVRNFSQQQFMSEKLMALGKMSAGLAHELNNPAAAMIRSSEELYRRIHQTPERFKSIITMRVTPEQTDQINGLLFAKIAEADRLELSLLEREARLDDLLDWLDERNIDHADDIADTLVDFGFTLADLDQITTTIDESALGAMLWWLESTLSLERLVGELRDSSTRISELIGSIKTYSHMDRDQSLQEVDIVAGLRSTVILLKHKWLKKGIKFVKEIEPDLPKIQVYGGEINQVWTNLIANAVEAMEPGGQLTIRCYAREKELCVEIKDNGPGVPADLQSRIYEPFFTTKEPGMGTGMGLDIVRRIIDHHNGCIELESQPGDTTFRVCLPLICRPEATAAPTVVIN